MNWNHNVDIKHTFVKKSTKMSLTRYSPVTCVNNNNNNNNNNIIIIIIIIIIYCNWVVSRWQWLFTCIQNMKLVTTKFKSGGLHEKHVVATWNLGNRLCICF